MRVNSPPPLMNDIASNNDKLWESHRFPYFTLSITFMLTVITITWLGVNNYIALNLLSNSVQDSIKTIDLIGHIMFYEEALSMSTQMGVLTGSQEWEKRYNYYNPRLCNALSETETLASNPAATEIAKKADLANQQLAKFEKKTFELCKIGQIAEAKKILMDPAYLSIKSEYKTSLNKYHDQLENIAINNVSKQIRIQKISFLIMIFNFIIIIISWCFTIRKIYSWKIDLDKSSEREIEYKNSLLKSNSTLEEMLKINVIIQEMSDKMQACQNVNEAYKLAGYAARKLFADISGSLAIYNADAEQLITEQRWGDYSCSLEKFELNDCWALRMSHPHIVKDITNEIICSHFLSMPRGDYICIPMNIQNGISGVVTLNAVPNSKLTEQMLDCAIKFSDEFRLVLSNIILRESLKEQATIDMLTGLYNRRHLEMTFPVKLLQSLRNKSKLCVAMVDIDNFKQINDAYGHEAGDAQLKLVGNLLKSNFRENDTVYRHGGEEFVIIIDAGIELALPRLQQMCQHLKSAEVYFQSKKLPILTLSIGIAEAPTHATTPDELINKADNALYMAKSEGKDRIVVVKSW